MSEGVWQRAQFTATYEEHVYYVGGQMAGLVMRHGLYAWTAEYIPNERDTVIWTTDGEESGKEEVEDWVHRRRENESGESTAREQDTDSHEDGEEAGSGGCADESSAGSTGGGTGDD